MKLRHIAYDTQWCLLQSASEPLTPHKFFTFHINFIIKEVLTHCDSNSRGKLYQLHFKATATVMSKQYNFTATVIVLLVLVLE